MHCAGMCTPLLMAVTNLTSSVVANRFLYNAGRILTYGILGSIFSGAGSFLPISPNQSLLSLLFGVRS
jgi:sulfite exporter TauE/SafE